MFGKIPQGTLWWFFVSLITVLLVVIWYSLKRRDRGIDIAVKKLEDLLREKVNVSSCKMLENSLREKVDVQSCDGSLESVKKDISVINDTVGRYFTKVEDIGKSLGVLNEKMAKMDLIYTVLSKELQLKRVNN